MDQSPEKSTGDGLHQVIQTSLSLLPAGAVWTALFNEVLPAPIERRRTAWMNSLAQRVSTLEKQGRLQIKDLGDMPEFVSTVVQATRAAMACHQAEKIDALRNAVLNTALGQALEESKREMFVYLTDRFTVMHLRILKALANWNGPRKASKGQITELACSQLPDLQREDPLAAIVVEELCRTGLLFWNDGTSVAYSPLGATQVSALGKEFLGFITDPDTQNQTKSSQ